MKAVKISLMLVAVLGMMVLLATSASAGNAWYTCQVKEAGTFGRSTVRFQLTDEGFVFENKWFKARSTQKDRMLAVALTAMSNGSYVIVYTDPSVSGTPEIKHMYLGPLVP